MNKGYVKPSPEISKFVSQIKSICKDQRKTKLSCRVIYEITNLLYLYSKVVPCGVKNARINELNYLLENRIVKNKNYFKDNDMIIKSYKFINNILDFLLLE